MTSSVKWKSKERDLISKGNGAWIHPGLIDRAGAAVLFTLKRFPWVKAVTGPRSRSSWSCQDRLSGWWRDRPQIDDGVARTLGLQWADTVVRRQSDFGSLLLLISYEIYAWFTQSLRIFWPPDSSKNLLNLRDVGKREEDKCTFPCR